MPVQRILAASDLSPASDAAIAWAAGWARAAAGELHLVHCVPRPVFPYWSGAYDDAHVNEWTTRATSELHAQIGRSAGPPSEPATVEVAFGVPTTEVGRRAAELDAAVLVLGPHRPRRALDDILGTTADRIIRTAPLPCVVANHAFPSALRQILFPVDFSTPSNHAIDVGMELLKPLLAAATEQAPVVIEYLFVSAYASPAKRNFAVEPALERVIERATGHLAGHAGVRLLPRILSAPLPVDGIRKAAERMDADLIILGTHGYSSLGRALIGSVASAVTRTVPYSTMLVPPPAD